MITLTREEAQHVLDALYSCDHAHEQDGGAQWYDQKLVDLAYELLRARLSEKEQEPVAWGVMKRGERVYYVNDSRNVCQGYAELYGHRSGYGAGKLDHEVIPLYTAPPQREWQGLTDEEAINIGEQCQWFDGDCERFDSIDFCRAIEAKLKEKNA